MLDFSWLFGSETNYPDKERRELQESLDDRVYQRRNGTMYIKSGEFVRSEEGQKLLKRFSENVDAGDTIHQD